MMRSAFSISVALAATAFAASSSSGTSTQAATPTITDGVIKLPGAPSQCTGSSIPFKTSVAVVGKQFSVWDAPFWWFNSPGHVFTFSTNTSGVALGNPFFDRGESTGLLPRKNANSFSANISLATGDGQMMFEAYASNGTEMPPASLWNASAKNIVSPTKVASFVLNIEGSGPCKNPLPVNQTCASGTLQLNKANWDAYGVDNWLANWMKSNGPFSNTSSMMSKFSTQLMNGLCRPCTFNNPCSCQGSCSSLPNNGKDADSERIWLAWNAMENLSDMFNNIYQSINVADAAALSKVGSIGADFIDDTIAIMQGTAPEDKLSKANHILGVLSPFLNFAAPFLFPEADIGLKVFSTALGFTSAMLGLEDKPGSAPITAQSDGLKNYMKAQGFLGDYVTSLLSSVETVHDDIFSSGTNLTTYLNGGGFVNRTLLGLDCDTCTQQAQSWTMQFLEMKVMNYVWWVQNVFIQYVPYGTVISNQDGQQTQFTEDICAGVFLKNDPDLIWCHTEDAVAGTSLKPGMARLTYYNRLANGNSPQHPNPTEDELNSHSNGILNMSTTAPGVKSTQQFTTTSPNVQWTFNKTTVMASSLAGFAKYGYGGDGMSDIVNQIQFYRGGNVPATAQLFNNLFHQNATSPGMFTLPVCVTYNLNYWPTIYGTANHPQGAQWCVCNTPWTKDVNGRQFNSSTPADLTTLVSLAYQLEGQQEKCSPGIWGDQAPGLLQDKMPPTMGTDSW